MRNEEKKIRAASCQIPCVQMSTMMIRCLNMCLFYVIIMSNTLRANVNNFIIMYECV